MWRTRTKEEKQRLQEVANVRVKKAIVELDEAFRALAEEDPDTARAVRRASLYLQLIQKNSKT